MLMIYFFFYFPFQVECTYRELLFESKKKKNQRNFYCYENSNREEIRNSFETK